MRQLSVRIPGNQLRVVHFKENEDVVEVLASYLHQEYGLPSELYWLDYYHVLEHVSIRLRLSGGKGGFGSNLRAQGNKMSTRKRSGGNIDCRDLSGRRLRSINEQKLIDEYLKREPELERKKEKEKKEKMLKALEAPEKKKMFEDVGYMRTLQETVDTVESAVYAALMEEEEEEEESSEEETDVTKGKRKVAGRRVKKDETGASTSVAV